MRVFLDCSSVSADDLWYKLQFCLAVRVVSPDVLGGAVVRLTPILVTFLSGLLTKMLGYFSRAIKVACFFFFFASIKVACYS